MRLFILLIYCICQSSVLLAQPELKQAEQWVKEAKDLKTNKQFSEAQALLQQAQAVFQEHQKWETYIKTGIDIAYLSDDLGDFERAIHQMDSLIHFGMARLGKEHESIALAYHKLGVLYYYYDEFKLAIEHYAQALDIRQGIFEAYHPDIARGYNNIALVYTYWGKYNKAIETFNLVIKQYAHIENLVKEAACYNYIAINYETLGDYEKALFYNDLALAIYTKIGEKESDDVASIYFNIGNLYDLSNQQEKAFVSANQALELYQQIDNRQKEAANTLNLLGNIQDNLENYEQALSYYRQSLAINQKVRSDDKTAIVHNWLNMAVSLQKKEDYSTALAYLDTALLVQEALYPKEKHLDFVLIYDNMGNTFHKMGQDKKAIIEYDKALAQLIPLDFYNKKMTIEMLAISEQKPHLLTVLSDKAQSLFALSKKNDPVELLKEALTIYHLIDELINKMRQDFGADGSKLFWIDKTQSIYEQAIAAALELYQITAEKRYAEQAFTFAEKSKAALLLESRREAVAKTLVDMDEKIWTKEQQLKDNIIHLEGQLWKLENQKKNSLGVKDSLQQAHRNYEQFIQQLETDFPNYYRLKYNTQISTISDIQNELLPKNGLMIEYFVGEKEVFIFSISTDAFEISRFPLPPNLSKSVENLRQSLTNKTFIDNDLKQNYQDFSTSAFALYQTFLDPVFKKIKRPIKQLIIIPDGVLSYIPFECLLTKEADNEEYDFIKLDYLIKKYAVSYNYSATLLQENQKRTKHLVANKKLLAFAPTYLATDSLISLTGTQEEVEAILPFYEQQNAFVKAAATKQRFLQTADNYGLIHLAMHGQVDEKNMNQSRLFFSNEDSQNTDYILYNYELASLNLSAFLVVLSACETGLGQLAKGEGVMSLARGFMNAGSSSVVMSLWQTNDKASQQLMIDFHRALSEGESKDQALQTAKLNYLQEPLDPLGHPYYWTGFVGIGDYSGIVSRSWWFNAWFWGIGIFLIVILSLYWRQNN